jgi:hypothetical protein
MVNLHSLNHERWLIAGPPHDGWFSLRSKSGVADDAVRNALAWNRNSNRNSVAVPGNFPAASITPL